MKKRFSKGSLLLTALTVSALSLTGAINATDITTYSELRSFLTTSTEGTTGILSNDITDVTGNLGTAVNNLILDGNNNSVNINNNEGIVVSSGNNFSVKNITMTSSNTFRDFIVAGTLNLLDTNTLADGIWHVDGSLGVTNIGNGTDEAKTYLGDSAAITQNQLCINPNATLSLKADTYGNINVVGTFTNNGTIELTGGTLSNSIVSGGKVNIETSSLTIGSSGSINDNVVTVNQEVEVSGGDLYLDSSDALNEKVTLTNGNLYINGVDDTNGEIDANGGNLTVSGATTLKNSDTDISQGVQTTINGALTIDGATVALDSTDSIGATVTLTSGNLDINNINDTTAGIDANGGTLTISGATTLTSNSSIAKDVITLVNNNLTLKDGAVAEFNDNDTWNATIENNASTVTFSGVTKNGAFIQDTEGSTTYICQDITLSTANGDSLTKGSIVIGDDSTSAGTLNTSIDLGADIIKTINTNGILNLTSGISLLDSDDTWKGTLNNNGCSLTLSGRDDTTPDTKQYNQTTGTLNIDNSKLTLNSGSSISDGTVVVGDGTNESTLTFNEGSTMTGGTLEVKSGSILNSTGSAVDVAVTNDGTYNLSSATINASIADSVGDGTKGTLNIEGTTSSAASATIKQANVKVKTAGTFTTGADVTANTSLVLELSAAIVNDNKITANNLTNAGTISGDNGVLVVSGTSSSSGDITQNEITLNGTFTNNADMTANDTLENACALTNTATITTENLTNTGTVDGDNGVLVVNGTGSSSGDITQNEITLNGTFTNNADMTAIDTLKNANNLTNTATVTAGTLNNTGTIDGTGNLVVDGTGNSVSENTISQTDITLSNAAGTFENNAELIATDTLSNAAGLTNTATITTENLTNTGTVDGDNGVLVVNGTGSSSGTITQNEITLNGTFTNNADMTAIDTLENANNLTNTATVTAGTLNNTGTIDGTGNLVVDGTGNSVSENTISQTDITLSNAAGTFENNANLTATGTLENANDLTNTATVTAGTLENTGTINGTGNLIVNGTGASISEDTISQTNITLSNATGTFENNADLIATDTLSNASNLTNNSNISADTIKNSGTLNTSVSETALTTNNDIQNSGVFNITGGDELTYDVVGLDGSTSGVVKISTNNDFNISSTISDNTIELTSNAKVLSFDDPTTAIANADLLIDAGYNGVIDIRNHNFETLNVQNLTLNSSGAVINMDSNLLLETMDSLSVSSFSNMNSNTLTINPNLPYSTMDILTNPNIFLFPIANSVTGDTRTNLARALNPVLPREIVSPVYIYRPSYNSQTGIISVTAQDFNSAVLASSVATQAGAYITQINSYEQAFSNMDQMMLMTREQRIALKNANKYAAQDTNNGVITYSPNQFPEQNRGVWFRPFASFEDVGLDNGPSVDNISYGGLVGGDSDLIELSNGWDMVWGAYAGYNGSHQRYDGNSIYQNGGMLGLNATWYKNNFFTGLTANVGVSVAEATTMYGKDNMTLLSTGVASKTGYNWELFDSKFIIQPSFMVSYSFINTFDYRNAADVEISSDPLNAIQIVPGLKFIGNLKHGWQPYLGVQMIWNILDETKFSASEVALPEMSVDPYIQYGVGVQKRLGDRFTGFGQIMMRNGGRNGISLQAGFRWALGDIETKSNSKASIKYNSERKINLSLK